MTGENLEALSVDLPDAINERTFGATNVDRVLKKFYNCVFLGQQETPYYGDPSMQDWNAYPTMNHRTFRMAEREIEHQDFA